MTLSASTDRRRPWLPPLLGAGLLAASLMLGPGPAAHGPGGDHDGHGDAPTTSPATRALPRLEAASESFELVAVLRAGELVILVDRYATNEPVLGASLELETANTKAMASFRTDQGDYVVTDAGLLTALRAPGEHALVFTLIAGPDSDLLEGKLVIPKAVQAASTDAPSPGTRHILIGIGGVGAAGLLLMLLARRRGRARHLPPASLLLMVVCWAMVAEQAQAGPGAHGPHGEHLDASSQATEAQAVTRMPDGSVNLPKNAQRRLAIRTTLTQLGNAPLTLELNGLVIPDPNASGRVQAALGGRIEPGPSGLPVVGQAVRRGEVLVYVRHHAPPYAQGAQQAQLADLRAQRRLAETRLQRLESLEGTVPRKEIEAARVEVSSLAERERSIGASLDSREALVAPVSGVIARSDLVAGQVVEPRDFLIEVIDPSRMLVEAVLADPSFAQRLEGASLSTAPDVSLRLIGVSQKLREGLMPLIFAASVKPGSGTALPLAIGQPVTLVARSRQRIRGVVLPAQAVVRNPSNEPVVWLKTGAERFVARPVQYQALDASRVVITQGLDADVRVVVEGAALIAQIR